MIEVANKNKFRLAILDLYDNTPNQGMANIFDLLAGFEAEISYEVFDVRGKREMPGLEFDMYLSTGGPGSPHEGDGIWEKLFFDWIQAVWAYNQREDIIPKFVFFICHSFQMACIYFQLGSVIPRKSKSMGLFPVHKTENGLTEPLFEGLEDPFFIADFREWQVVQPNMDEFKKLGANILALEKKRPHVPLERAVMAIRFSKTVFGTQFHPEAEPNGMVRHFSIPDNLEELRKRKGDEKLEVMMEWLNDPGKLKKSYDTIIPAFLRSAIRGIQQASEVK